MISATTAEHWVEWKWPAMLVHSISVVLCFVHWFVCSFGQQVTWSAGIVYYENNYNDFVNAAVAVDSSCKTASSSASWSRFSPPSNFVNWHMSTMWFMVCCWSTITGRWLGETLFMHVSTTWSLTCPETVNRRPCMTKKIETWLSDSRVGNNNVFGHRSWRPEW